jgi:hypothetical protein
MSTVQVERGPGCGIADLIRPAQPERVSSVPPETLDPAVLAERESRSDPRTLTRQVQPERGASCDPRSLLRPPQPERGSSAHPGHLIATVLEVPTRLGGFPSEPKSSMSSNVPRGSRPQKTTECLPGECNGP